jgi:hypothetical protein
MAGRLTKRKREKFIKLLQEGRTIRSACRGINASHSTLYRAKAAVPGDSDFYEGFREAWDDALCDGVGVWEDSLFEMAIEGEPITSTNRQTGETEVVGYRKSERAIEFGLRAKDPDTYAERRRLEGADGGPIRTESVTAEMTDEEKRERAKYLREILGKKDKVKA